MIKPRSNKHLECKRSQHYVWANYLRNWSLNNRDVWYSTSNGKSSLDSVRGIAMERDFYKITYLEKQDVEIILQISNLASKELQKQHKYYLSDFLKIQSVEDLYNKSGKKNNEIEDHLKAWKSNAIENLYTGQEKHVNNIIKYLKNKDLTILDDNENMMIFMNFFGHQTTRTKS
ncbi:DUF4238 domain-containing protein [Acinetobacter sp. ANC 3789]|uniref:DUF4238 domain-containing protein n=1 Tax=Acinetobacter sp. ANC 3789 TaxID=1217714 RepID=UPI001D177DB0|nr:DUF4238 domain-containing protein [Acinetobacter sp. ANC 3789]